MSEEFEYPLFKQCLWDGTIVKFTGLKTGVVQEVHDINSIDQVGDFSAHWHSHTNEKVWGDVTHSRIAIKLDEEDAAHDETCS